MKKIFIIIFLLYSYSNLLSAQEGVDKKRDYQWLFGYNYAGNIYANLMDFNIKPTTISPVNKKMFDVRQTLAQICTKDGKLLLYTVGCDIRDANHNIVLKGDSLSYGNYWNLACDNQKGMGLVQGAIILPKPNNPNIYSIFHVTLTEKYESFAEKLMYSEVDMSKNNGNGLVTIKNKKIITDTLTYSNITAVRHANGRDWWIMIPEKSTDSKESNSHYYYTTLLTPDSLGTPFRQSAGKFLGKTKWDKDYSCFSPDGSKFARYRSKDAVYLYDFDRNLGKLSNMRYAQLTKKTFAGGVAFSPNSKYLYVSSDTVMYQIDTEVKPLQDGVVIIGTYDNYVVNGFFPTAFDASFLAPDCKIYINTSETTEFLHTVNYPDRKGLACGFEQRAIKLPTKVAWSLPNYPNFRLGKIGDNFSPCDSTLNPYITVAGEVKEKPIIANLYPNPASEVVNLDLFGYLNQYKKGVFNIYDTQGKLAATYPLYINHDEYRFDISNLANGMYFWHLVLDDKIRQTGKVVVMNE
jgi:Secretion system C-terminal sorting domain